MRGVDTNVLVRFLVRDDFEETRRAREFLTVKCTAESPGVVNHIVLCELVWVLDYSYDYSREKILLALEGIIGAAQLTIPNRDDVRVALTEFQDGADFPDALIAIVNLRLGCEHTVTFDRKAGRRAGFRAL